jgi:hypothetical protein
LKRLTAVRVCGPNHPSAVIRSRRWSAVTAAPREPVRSTVPRYWVSGLTGVPEVAVVGAGGVAFAWSRVRQVAWSTTPVAGTPYRFCHEVTAACVPAPKLPSTVVPTACWTARTTGPVEPRATYMPE